MANEINVDIDKLTKVCLDSYNAFTNKTGIFRNGFKRFLPQYNIPEELENSPWTMETKMPKEAADYLFLLASMEKVSLTRTNMRNGLRTWTNPNKKWIFNPLEVAQRTEREVLEICKKNLEYVIGNFSTNYQDNARIIAREYKGDTRILVNGLSVEESRKRLMRFKGIGSGIANLFIIYMLERKIAEVKDPERILLKVDVHKGRLPLNTDCIKINESGEIRRDLLVPVLENAYWEVCTKNNLDPIILDASLWIIGSGICAKRDYFFCKDDCPLEKICVSCVPEDKITGRFQINSKGKRLEARRNVALKNQLPFDFE